MVCPSVTGFSPKSIDYRREQLFTARHLVLISFAFAVGVTIGRIALAAT